MTPAPAPTAVDPYALFLRARSAVSSARYPDKLDYTIAIAGVDGATPRENHYRASARPAEDVVDVAPLSVEQAAQPPPVPHGFNVTLNISISGGRGSGVGTYVIPLGRPAASPDLLGVPLLTPTYSFGLARWAPKHDFATAESPLPVIAVVSTGARDYSVTLVDEPVLDGSPTYHLKLVALRSPKVNRLRELWAGESDYLPRKAVVAGNFTLAPLVDVPWTIDFSVIAGAPFVSRETADAPLYMPHRRVVRDATISFDDVREAGATLVDRPLLAPNVDDTTLTEPQP
ncbi:MAG TPA: hypothetical protein VGF86_00085 [Candidatus Tumulicola sp.]|jgi:hypothetical protein